MAGEILVCLLLSLARDDSISAAVQTDTVRDLDEMVLLEESGMLLWSEEETADFEMLEHLAWLREHRMDLNTMTRRQLESIPGLSGADIHSVLEARRSLGRFSTVEQLGSIGETGERIYGILHPYVTVKTSRKMDSPYCDLRLRAGRQAAGSSSEEAACLGDDRKEYGRLECSTGPLLQIGATYEKSPGEPAKYGFLSWFVASRGLPVLDQVVVGDFAVSSGVGLVFRRAAIFAKQGTADPTCPGRASVIQPYRSVNGQNFFRGIAFESHVPGPAVSLGMTGFISDRAIDASLDDSGGVSSFDSTGLYRTPGEIARLRAVRERVIGGRVVLSLSGSWSFGVTGYRALLDRAVVPNGPFEPGGRESRVIGVEWRGDAGLSTLYGEYAASAGGGTACVAGAMLDLRRGRSVGVLVRSYSPAFNNRYSAAFREGSLTRNEIGVCVDWCLPVSPNAALSGYLDLFKVPWQSYRQPFPVSGSEVVVRCDVSMPESISLSMRASMKRTALNSGGADSLGRPVVVPGDRVRWKGGADASWGSGRRLRLESRIELTGVVRSADGGEGRGFLLLQGIRAGPASWMDVDVRLTFFDCRGPDARFATFESDLPGAFTLQPVSGKGRRWYLVIRVSPRAWLRLAAKYSETQLIGRADDGVGAPGPGDETTGHISAQVDVTL